MKNVVITGGSSGIGLSAVKAFAALGYRVLIIARNQAKLDQSAEAVRAEFPQSTIETYSLDLTDFKAVQSASSYIKTLMPTIDILALNAGLYTGSNYQTGVSGYESMISATHLGHFLLTQLLLDHLLKSEDPRVVVTASEAHRVGGLDIDSFSSPKYSKLPYLGPIWGYGQSKLANILFTRELAKRLDSQDVFVSCFHPGVVDTGFSRNIPKRLVDFGSKFLITPEKGADTLVYLATDSTVARLSGQYFYKRKVIKGNKKSRSDTLSKRLWDESEKILADYV